MKFNPYHIAAELVEQFINGNRKHVRDTIHALPAPQAAAVAFELRNRLQVFGPDVLAKASRLLCEDLPEQ